MSARELNLKAEREAFERACPGLNPLRYVDDSAYCSEVVEYHWKGWLAARRADLEIRRPDTGSHLDSEAGSAYGPVHVVGDLVRNLLTLDQAAPIYSAFHVDYQGERRCRTRPVSTSWERVIDGKWVDPARTDVPYAVIVWAKPEADERAACGEPTKPEGAKP